MLFDDLRKLSLHHVQDGTLFAVLDAQPPWNRSPHSFEIRQKVVGWQKAGLITIRGMEDAVDAYHAFVRSNVLVLPGVIDDYAVSARKYRAEATQPAAPTVARVDVPRDGWISLGRRRAS